MSKTSKNVIKWIIILFLVAMAYVLNDDFFREAWNDVLVTPKKKLILCALFSNLYFVAEGVIISSMTSTCERRLSVFEGITCTYMCSFYRLATLGSGNGIAQVYYYNVKGIDAGRGTGMSMVQYTFQKITIGVFGVISFIVLLKVGSSNLMDYSKYMFLGATVISLVCLALFLMTVSKTISRLVMSIGHFFVKDGSKLAPKLDKAQHAIDNLQEQGRLTWKNKKLFFMVVLLNFLKLSCWYIIPGILFYDRFNVNPIVCLLLMSVCNMVGCVMLAPSGVGTLDFVFAIFFGAIIPNAEAIAAAIVLYRFFTWGVPFLIGLIPALFFGKKNEPTVNKNNNI